MPNLEGVYWDLDGTIANTELEAHLPAFNRAFNDYGLDWFWEKSVYIDLLKVNGGKNRISFFASSINEKITKDLIIQLHKRKQYHYLELVKSGSVSLKIGVKRLVNELFKKKIRQFIVTSSSQVQVSLLIKTLFKEFRSRHHYATTGARIYLNVDASFEKKAKLH